MKKTEFPPPPRSAQWFYATGRGRQLERLVTQAGQPIERAIARTVYAAWLDEVGQIEFADWNRETAAILCETSEEEVRILKLFRESADVRDQWADLYLQQDWGEVIVALRVFADRMDDNGFDNVAKVCRENARLNEELLAGIISDKGGKK